MDEFGVPSFGEGEFASLIVDASDEALQAANAVLLDRDAELTSAEDAVDGFFLDGAGAEFDDLGHLQAVVSDLRNAETEAQGLEDALTAANDDFEAFFGYEGLGADFDDSTAISAEIARLHTIESRCKH